MKIIISPSTGNKFRVLYHRVQISTRGRRHCKNSAEFVNQIFCQIYGYVLTSDILELRRFIKK